MSQTPVPPHTPGPEGASAFPFGFALLLVGVPAAVLLVGLLIGSSVLGVIGLAVLVLAAVFVGVGSLMRRRGFERRPGRHPVRPPSA